MALTREELDRLRIAMSDLANWSERASAITQHREVVVADASVAFEALRARLIDISVGNGERWAALPLRLSDSAHLSALARSGSLSQVTPDEAAWIGRLAKDVPVALADARSNFGLRRIFGGRQARESGERAARYLLTVHRSSEPRSPERALARLDDRAHPTTVVAIERALDSGVGLTARLSALPAGHLLVRDDLVPLPAAVSIVQSSVAGDALRRQQAIDAGVALRKAETDRVVREMPLDRLKEATRERVRVTPLVDTGFNSVYDVMSQPNRIDSLPGIGVTSANRIRGAARTLWQSTYEEMPVRIDITAPSPQTHELLKRLAAWDTNRQMKNATRDLARSAALAPLARVLDSDVSLVALFGDEQAFLEAVDAVVELSQRTSSSTRARVGSSWDDFLRRPADYFVMLQELGFLLEDEDASHGGLPDDLVAAIREFPLELEYLSASLRGYQAFAARFALVQRKVIIGDEMGLGKTVEALAVLAHLRAKGEHHTLVVCPAAVVTNWMREVRAKSALDAHRLHGTNREHALRSWQRRGGVAVTTYESLEWLEVRLPTAQELACVVLDEAHYIKNPRALRAQRSARLVDRAARSLLLSGTPLENRVDEFRTLVKYLRPDLVVDADDLRPRRFRQQVAPAYLRRSQEDVLTELPPLVEVEEWLPLSAADASAYRDAVAAGNFHAMRQAAMRGTESQKLQRLRELVEEAEDNGRKVIVFSNYLAVLQTVIAALSGTVFGPLTGAVPAARRQDVVDRFSAAPAGAVLAAQILAGGVGLNIQAASVVIICEPQLKPTTEWQAIARARRMGQLQTVQVHRLLTEEGVDVRISEILATKQALFADFAAVSDTADSAPEAFDISEADLVRDVITSERRRLFGGLDATTEEAVDTR